MGFQSLPAGESNWYGGRMTPLMLSRSDLTSLQCYFREASTQSEDLPTWLTAQGLDRWETVLRLRHPVLPWCHFHTQDGERGYWVQIQGTLGAVLQPRVVHHEQAPVVLKVFSSPPPLLSVSTPAPFMPDQARQVMEAWLDHVGASYRSWDPKQQERADGQAALGARLSGASWALLTGRGAAAALIQDPDLRPTDGRLA